MSAAGIVADAPPAIANDTPAAPKAGKAAFRRLRFGVCFACAIVELSSTFRAMLA
jgi:hypothetical protein